MALSSEQLIALKADILATPELADEVAGGADNAIAAYYNEQASPAYVVWKSLLTVSEVREAVDWSEVVALSTNPLLAFQVLTSGDINPANTSIRNAFMQIFSGPNNADSRAALNTASQRNANRIEKLFAVGSGTSGSPSTMAYEGNISSSDVRAALNS